MTDNNAHQILARLEAGEISADEAADLLSRLEPVAEVLPADEPLDPSEAWVPGFDPAAARGARFWIYPLIAGGVVLILGALVMGLVYSLDAAPGWRICGWLPMILGLLVTLLALWTRRARWLHLRITDAKTNQRRIAFSFPLPLGLAAWGLRVAQPFVPQLRETGVDDLIIALREGMGHDEPLFVDVHNEEGGERIQVYLG